MSCTDESTSRVSGRRPSSVRRPQGPSRVPDSVSWLPGRRKAEVGSQIGPAGLAGPASRTGPGGVGGLRSQGTCRAEDPALFLPVATTVPAMRQACMARAVCRRCGVRLPPPRSGRFWLNPTVAGGVRRGAGGGPNSAAREPPASGSRPESMVTGTVSPRSSASPTGLGPTCRRAPSGTSRATRREISSCSGFGGVSRSTPGGALSSPTTRTWSWPRGSPASARGAAREMTAATTAPASMAARCQDTSLPNAYPPRRGQPPAGHDRPDVGERG
jgi:hypothetical protein